MLTAADYYINHPTAHSTPSAEEGVKTIRVSFTDLRHGGMISSLAENQSVETILT